MIERYGVIKTLESEAVNLTETEKAISQYILDNLWQIPELTISELSKRSKTSPAAVTRFSKKIGCDGFQELKLKLSSEIALLPYLETKETDGKPDIKKGLGEIGDIIKESLKAYNEDNIQPLLEMLYAKDVIYVHGVGLSHLAALNLHQKLNRVGKICIPINDRALAKQSMFTNPDRILYWGISNSGTSQEILDVMNLTKELGIPSITLTSPRPNPMAESSDFPLFTCDVSPEPSASNPSIYAQFALIDYLFLSYIKKYNIHIEKSELF